MTPSRLPRQLPGPFVFLDPSSDEINRLRSVQERALPLARKIFLEDEEATPLTGFPILISSRLMALEKALEEYIVLEEKAQFELAHRRPFDRARYAEAWQRYSRLLASATEYTVLSSYGRAYPNVFWLRHSSVLARTMSGTLRRLAQIDSAFAREQGARIRYVVFFHYLDRTLSLTYRLIRRLARQVGEAESDLFPGLLTIMRDNVLIFTEEQISEDLSELGTYLAGHLGVDGRDFRQRLGRTREWHRQQLESNDALRRAVRDLLDADLVARPERLLHRPGYVRYLSSLEDYDPARLLEPEGIELWEELLPTLKEYELLRSFQRLVLPVTREGERLVATDPRTRGTGLPARRLYLSITTRPLDFMTPWVLDPEVGRFGMIYDISQFSQSLTEMKRTSQVEQERTFQMIFRFQRQVNQVAFNRRLRLEKYLGDGALYSGINRPHDLLVAALYIQRLYREAVAAGFPFDRGLRIALNFGQYRMLPIQSSQPGEAERYEFFGHGIVELTRLITGKTMQEIGEIKSLLVSLGYSPDSVDRFFAPLERRHRDVVSRLEEGRRFRAYINPNGTLINEGIVATRQFVSELDQEGSIEALHSAREESHLYTVVQVRDGVDEVLAGFRKLGTAEFKGLGPLVVYEVVGSEQWTEDDLEPCNHSDLISATEEAFSGVPVEDF